MPKFIKTAKTSITTNRHGDEIEVAVPFTDEEIADKLVLNPSLLLEVTESHAVQVLRPQGLYQEVGESALALTEENRQALEDLKEAKAARAAKKANPKFKAA